MLDVTVLVLNRCFLPVHVTSARRAFVLLYQGIARAVDEHYDTFDFEAWRVLAVRDTDETVGTVGGPIRVPRVVQLARAAVQIEGELVERARLRIAELSAKLGLDHCERLVQTGNIKSEVVRIAQTRAIDLIVIGSRERHGVSILFNFTEDTVLHAAPCDVLAVRWKKT